MERGLFWTWSLVNQVDEWTDIIQNLHPLLRGLPTPQVSSRGTLGVLLGVWWGKLRTGARGMWSDQRKWSLMLWRKFQRERWCPHSAGNSTGKRRCRNAISSLGKNWPQGFDLCPHRNMSSWIFSMLSRRCFLLSTEPSACQWPLCSRLLEGWGGIHWRKLWGSTLVRQ